MRIQDGRDREREVDGLIKEPLFLPPNLAVDIVARLWGVCSLVPFLLSLPRDHPSGQRQHCQQGVIPSPKPRHQPGGMMYLLKSLASWQVAEHNCQKVLLPEEL